jgi:hypothetical protein
VLAQILHRLVIANAISTRKERRACRGLSLTPLRKVSAALGGLSPFDTTRVLSGIGRPVR